MGEEGRQGGRLFCETVGRIVGIKIKHKKAIVTLVVFFTWRFKMTCCMRMILLAHFVFENRAESGFADL